MQKSLVCLYTNNELLKKNRENNAMCKIIKKNKMLRNKFNQGVEISVHWKLGHFSERNWTYKWMENIPYL